MARPPLIEESVIVGWLGDNPQWERDGVVLKRQIMFADFSEAFAFMTRVAMVAESLDHHPNWANVYNTVDIAVTTHDVGGITKLDTELADAVNAILGETSR